MMDARWAARAARAIAAAMAADDQARRDRFLRDCYEEGKEAGFIAKEDCPYHEPSAARAAWMLGYEEGQADLAKSFCEYRDLLFKPGRLTERDKRLLRQ